MSSLLQRHPRPPSLYPMTCLYPQAPTGALPSPLDRACWPLRLSRCAFHLLTPEEEFFFGSKSPQDLVSVGEL